MDQVAHGLRREGMGQVAHGEGAQVRRLMVGGRGKGTGQVARSLGGLGDPTGLVLLLGEGVKVKWLMV